MKDGLREPCEICAREKRIVGRGLCADCEAGLKQSRHSRYLKRHGIKRTLDEQLRDWMVMT